MCKTDHEVFFFIFLISNPVQIRMLPYHLLHFLAMLSQATYQNSFKEHKPINSYLRILCYLSKIDNLSCAISQRYNYSRAKHM